MMDFLDIVTDERFWGNDDIDSYLDIGIAVDGIDDKENDFEVSDPLENGIYVHHAPESTGRGPSFPCICVLSVMYACIG